VRGGEAEMKGVWKEVCVTRGTASERQ